MTLTTTAVGLLLVACIAAIQARAARGTPRHRLEEICTRLARPGLADEIASGSEHVAFVAATIVAVAATVATLVASLSPDLRVHPGRLRGAGVLLWTGLVWTLLVAVPMLLARTVGARILVTTWAVWRPLVAVVTPLVSVLSRLGVWLAAPFGKRGTIDEPTVEEEVRAVVDEALREGRLEGAARDMIEGVMELRDARVGRIMTPRTSMVSLPVDAALPEVLRVATDSAHTRLPVWDRSPDDVVGILHTREVLTRIAENTVSGAPLDLPSLRPLLRPPFFVPETMSVQNLLREFQRTHTHMAMVTDEFGGVSGLVTIEDALEEIVGEIADEHDDALSDGVRQVAEGTYEVRASVRLADLAAATGLDLPDATGFGTVGGLVFHHLGRIPLVGDSFRDHGAEWEVIAATRRRVDLVRVTRNAPAD